MGQVTLCHDFLLSQALKFRRAPRNLQCKNPNWILHPRGEKVKSISGQQMEIFSQPNGAKWSSICVVCASYLYQPVTVIMMYKEARHSIKWNIE